MMDDWEWNRKTGEKTSRKFQDRRKEEIETMALSILISVGRMFQLSGFKNKNI